jgi:hypothetical protein
MDARGGLSAFLFFCEASVMARFRHGLGRLGQELNAPSLLLPV